MLRLALVLALAPAAAFAVPQQMLNQIENRLGSYQIKTDVSKLTNAQATALYFELTSSDGNRVGDRLRKRQRLLNIIRKGEDF